MAELVTCCGEALAETVVPVGQGSDFAIVPAAAFCPRVAHKCVLQEPEAQRYVISEYACTPEDWLSRPATANVTYRWSWSGPCVHAWDGEMDWGDA